MNLSKIKRDKRGDIFDMLSFVIVFFILATGFFIISFIVPYITNGLRTAGLNNSAQGRNALNTLDNYGTTGIQKGVFWVFIGLCIATLISAFFADTHPVWLFLYIFILIITIIIAGYLANSYEYMINLNVFNGWSQSYIAVIMQHIILITLVVAVLSFIIMFTKNFFLGGGGL